MKKVFDYFISLFTLAEKLNSTEDLSASEEIFENVNEASEAEINLNNEFNHDASEIDNKIIEATVDKEVDESLENEASANLVVLEENPDDAGVEELLENDDELIESSIDSENDLVNQNEESEELGQDDNEVENELNNTGNVEDEENIEEYHHDIVNENVDIEEDTTASFEPNIDVYYLFIGFIIFKLTTASVDTSVEITNADESQSGKKIKIKRDSTN